MKQLAPLTVGDLIDETFRLYRRNFALFAGIVAVIAVPQTLLNMVITAAIPNPVVTTGPSGGATVDAGYLVQALTLVGIRVIIALVVSQLIIAALSRAISERYLGRTLTVGEAYAQVGWRTFVTLVLALLLQGLIVLTGLVLLVIPGIFLAIRLAFISQVIVLERTGVFVALSRSWQLVRGSWWRVLGILLLVGILVGVLSGLVSALVGAALGLALGSGTVLNVASQAVGGIIGIFIQPVQLGASVLLYYDLRVRKEGFDLELAAVQLGGPQPA